MFESATIDTTLSLDTPHLTATVADIKTLPKVFIKSNKANIDLMTYKKSSFINTIDNKTSIIFPIDIDTEYVQPLVADFLSGGKQSIPRLNLTAQIDHPTQHAAIYLHPDLFDKPLPRYTLLKADRLPKWKKFDTFAPVTYLNDLGFNAELDFVEPLETDTRPTFTFKMYAHFLISDIGSIGTGDYQEIIRDLYRDSRLTLDRRAVFQTGDFNKKTMVVDNALNLKLNGIDYKVSFQLMDSIALQGQVGLKDLASNVGVKMDSKDTLDHLKTRMDKALLYHPETFKEYALGDLVVYEVMEKWQDLVQQLFISLNVAKYYQSPRLTMGGTVAGLIEARLRKLLNCPIPTNKKDDLFLEYLGESCTNAHLSSMTTGDTKYHYKSAKVGGGRAYNNNPIVAVIRGEKESCIDMDLAGAYGSVMIEQPFPIGGLPILHSFENKNRPTLNQFFKRWKKELIGGLWVLNIRTKKGFKFSEGQDYFRSWHVPNIKKNTPVDTKQGETKFYSHEIFNGQLTSFDFTYIYDDISPTLRNEFLNNVIIDSFILYPKSLRVDDIETIKTNTHEKPFRWKLNGQNLIFKAKKFYTTTLGELVITDLMAWRAINPKNGTDKQKVLNTLYKLFVNTTYGCSVSPYFQTANVVVGNNITAAVRRGAWCLEKACNGQQSITDGGIFPLNRVLKRRSKRLSISPKALFKTYDKTAKQLNTLNCELSPLLGGETKIYKKDAVLKISVGGVERDFKNSEINAATLKHIQTVFPKDPLYNATSKKMDVKNVGGQPSWTWKDKVGVLDFEMKTAVKQTSLHGTANYRLEDFDGEFNTKMRSYTKKQHYGFSFDESDELIHDASFEGLTVAKFFHNELLKNPESVKLPPPYLIEKILKPKDFKKSIDKWGGSFPSWNVLKVGLLRPCTLSQFQFQDEEQRDKWFKYAETLKRKYGYSYELFFINDDGTLNYQDMIESIDGAINRGVDTPRLFFTKYKKTNYPTLPTFKAWAVLKDKVINYQENIKHISLLDDLEDVDFDADNIDFDNIE